MQSPDRVRREMSNATDRLEEERKEVVRIEKEAAQMKTMVGNAGKALKDLSKATSALEEVETEVSKVRRRLRGAKRRFFRIHISAANLSLLARCYRFLVTAPELRGGDQVRSVQHLG